MLAGFFQCSSCTFLEKTVGFFGRSIASRARELLSTNSKNFWRPSPYAQQAREPKIGSTKFPLSWHEVARGLPGADPIRHIYCRVIRSKQSCSLISRHTCFARRSDGARHKLGRSRTSDFVHLRLSVASLS